ncbi:hypothetical protein B9Z55_023530 [Caenorhabditis nigoni]|uniref:Uncharacterized protein n=1 Tax=Caenorhabditis nigoni TaxID=1611254 RepID=A0A2G5SQ28_9PELO|nr:hypothetical protein B9Z55_023530 [Caenorhabditis nigoni]
MEKSVAASSTSSNASSTAEATLSNPEAHTSVTSNSEATTSSDSIATHLLQKERQPTFPKKISAIALTSQIETIASYSDLKSIEKKASLAIEKMNKTGDKTIPFKNFNLLIGSMIVCLEENRIGFHQIYSPSVSPVH